MTPSQLADELEHPETDACLQGHSNRYLLLTEHRLLAAALRLAEAAADPNFHRLELGRLRSAYRDAKKATLGS